MGQIFTGGAMKVCVLILMVFFLLLGNSCRRASEEVKIQPKVILPKKPPLPKAKKVIFASVNKISLIVRKSKPKVILDNSVIAKILKLFNDHTQIHDHKCSSVATLVFEGDVNNQVLSLLSGHQKDFYEFRYNNATYKISRKIFFSISLFKDFEVALLKHGK